MQLRTSFFRSAILALLALTAACSSPPPVVILDAAAEPVDDVVDEVFVGTGNVVFAWTVLGMPPAQGCAMAGGVSVRFPTNGLQFAQDVVVPCTQGEYRLNDTFPGTLGITPELIDSAGMRIYDYTVDAVITRGETTTADVRFEPRGRLTVRWTINGMPAPTQCPMVGGNGVRFSVQHSAVTRDSPCPTAPSATFTNLQVGETRVTGTLYFSDLPDGGHGPDPVRVMGTGDVPSNAAGTVTLDFPANVLAMP